MKIARTRQELRSLRNEFGDSLGFVPTMGALHHGHRSLLLSSKAENKFTALSIFVNPTQFGPKEDFSCYPRTLEEDLALAEAAGVDLVFTPTQEEIYPPGFHTFIEVEKVSEPLCGHFRPGHFRGVATVVYQLLALVRPQRAYFGQKDIQQCVVIERMVHDLLLPVELQFCETLREVDGLALSSRNRYLSPQDRERATVIYRALSAGKKVFIERETSITAILNRARQELATVPEFQVQYCEVRSRHDLSEIARIEDEAVLAIAGYLGQTRLIDNLLLKKS